ncbi:MAG: monofunctional biosynthetic peptidoglycan transglycosylase [Alphaproteobacteria bacterium]|nr:MAG: monofunctional biosynthetic peptidoglycan transglycosylase [Alphaproteobacteria bacterium]
MFVVFVKYSFSFFYSIYSSTKVKDSFYAIEIKDDIAYYHRVIDKPPTWVPLEKISKRLQQAIISSEDGKFYDHPGYDLEQLQKAINESFVLKKKMRGASTITQQLVKNLYLSHEKTFGRKAHEFMLAIIIERSTDKKKILEMYLNVIEYGKGLYGIDAASKYYFNKNAANLNAREAAFLAMLLPSPKKYSKSFKSRTLTPFANRIIASILLKMRQAGYIGEEEYITQLNGTFTWEKPPVAVDAKIEEAEGADGEFIDAAGNSDNTLPE